MDLNIGTALWFAARGMSQSAELLGLLGLGLELGMR
jgi:hypothetical protein